MVKVRLWGSLADTALGADTVKGAREVEVEADTLRALLDALGAAYPALGPQLSRGVSVSIDGRIYNDAWFTPIGPDSEVILLPRIVGG